MLASALDELVAAASTGFPTALARVASARSVVLDPPLLYEKYWDWRSSAVRPVFPVFSIRWTDSTADLAIPAAGIRDSRHRVTLAYVMKSTDTALIERHVKHVPEAIALWLDTFPIASKSAGKTITRIAPPNGKALGISTPVEQIREDSGTTTWMFRVEVDLTIEVRDPVIP